MITFSELKQKITSNPFFESQFYLKHRHFIVPGIVLGIAIFISGLVTIPQIFKLFETFKTIEELSQRREFFQTKNATLSAIDVELYRDNLDTALIALPVDKDIPGVTGELLVALSASGMKLTGINFANSNSDSNKVKEFNLKFEVTGPESNLKSFLERVKLSPRIVKMTSIEASKAKSGIINASINFVTLYQELPKDIGSVEEKVPEITPADSKVLADIKDKVKDIPQITTQPGLQPVSGKINPFVQ